MPAEATIVHTFRVGPYTAELSLPASAVSSGFFHAMCEWSPHVPTRPLNADEQGQYQAGLAEVMRKVVQAARSAA